jgi:hypothetical protein
MTTRTRAPKKVTIFAFAGNGELDKKNTEALLDQFIPEELNASALIPDTIRRTQKTLMHVWSWLDEVKIPYEKLDPADIVPYLTEALEEGADVTLVLAWTDGDKIAEQLLDQALEAKIPVKDLCKAWDDLEWEPDDQTVPAREQEDPEPPAATKTRGKPRGTTQAKEPAAKETTQTTTQTTQAAEPLSGSAVLLLEEAIRTIVREEINLRFPEKATVHALVNEDGDYKIALKGRPARGWTAVMLTPAEAASVGLEVPGNEEPDDAE